jgi:hypothetical protein
MTVIRLDDRSNVEYVGGNPVRASDVYLVTGATPIAALQSSELNTAAANGSLYPGTTTDQNLRQSSRSLGRRVGSDSHEVICNYTPGGIQLTGGFLPPDRTDPAFAAYRLTFAQTTFTIPIIQRIDEVIVPNLVDPNSEQRSYFWSDPVYQKVERALLSFGVEFNLPDGFGTGDVNGIADQLNKIHTFGGRKHKFVGGNVSTEGRAGQYRVSFSWEHEPGFVASDFTSWGWTDVGGGKYRLPGILPVPTRAPFGEYIIRPAPLPITPESGYDLPAAVSPEIVSQVFLAESPTGYQSLPGYGSYWTI